jgi:hypothetical protein
VQPFKIHKSYFKKYEKYREKTKIDLLEHPFQVLDNSVLEIMVLSRLKDVEFFLDGPGDLFEILLSHVQLSFCL